MSGTDTPLVDGAAGTALPFAHGGPPARGVLRALPEDFQVDERHAFEPEGEGNHALLHIEKRNANTEWVARLLARHAGVPPVAVGYAGLKDRAALTRQWFSVDLQGRAEPDWRALECPDLRVLSVTRHCRKLRRGALAGNAFRIRVRALAVDADALEARLQQMAVAGVPNYFGEQRFGRGGANVHHARAMLTQRRRVRDRHQRGLYLSAARAFLFNLVAAERVARGSWCQAIAGDVMMLEGSRSVFVLDSVDACIEQRLARMDIHPTGPMWGRGTNPARADTRALEERVLAPLALWRDGLEHAGLRQERRALRVAVRGLCWEVEEAGAVLVLAFVLPPGAYATAVLREIVASAGKPVGNFPAPA